ncbi:MAG: hypothetical protein ABIJ48_04560 [Actinomycetota bacterium]
MAIRTVTAGGSDLGDSTGRAVAREESHDKSTRIRRKHLEPAMKGAGAGGGIRCYVCAGGPGFGGCGRMATVADPVEALIAEVVLQRLDTPSWPPPWPTPARPTPKPTASTLDCPPTRRCWMISPRTSPLAASLTEGWH